MEISTKETTFYLSNDEEYLLRRIIEKCGIITAMRYLKVHKNINITNGKYIIETYFQKELSAYTLHVFLHPITD